MGAEQSTGGNAKSRRRFSEPVPELGPDNSDAMTSSSSMNFAREVSSDLGTDSNGNKSSREADKMSQSTLVVVNTVEQQLAFEMESDPIMQRLNSIPNFLPILDHLPKKFPWSKPGSSDQIMSKLHSQSVIRVGRLYNGFVRKHTTIIAREQTQLIKDIKQVDKDVDTLMKHFVVRQKKCAQYALKFELISEISKTIIKCQTTLQDALTTAETLNDLLPSEERLETFRWCSEDDDRNTLDINVKEEKPVSVSTFLPY